MPKAKKQSATTAEKEAPRRKRDRGVDKLTDAKIRRSLKKPGMYLDGAGLYFRIAKGSRPDLPPTKNWIFQYTWLRKERQLGLGSFHTVTLKQAREAAAAARVLISQGTDPIAERRKAKLEREAQVVAAAAAAAAAAETAAVAAAAATELAKTKIYTFEKSAEKYIETHSPHWRNPKHRAQWASTLRKYVFPTIGALPVDEIDTEHMTAILKTIWIEIPETANRVRGRIEQILDMAKAEGHRKSTENPARLRGHLEHLLPKLKRKKEHHAALDYSEIPKFMTLLRSREGIAARALEFLILTASRTNEVIGLNDAELNIEKKLWTIPASRMKAGVRYRVPLSKRAIEILKSLPREADNPFLFMGQSRGTHISNMAMLKVLARMERADLTVHGFRSSFSSWANDTTNASRTTIEMSLAHGLDDPTEAAYFRSDNYQKRCALLQQWEQYCERATKNNVTPLHRARRKAS